MRRIGPVLAVAVALRGLSIAILAVVAAAAGHTAHQRLIRWDANWYAGIAANGYGFTRVLADGRHLSDYAFFPLYPALERVVHDLLGLTYKDAGLVISWPASIVAVLGVFAVGERLAGRRAALVLAALWCGFPTAIVLSMAYSEAVFVALCAWALLAVLRQRWLTAGLLAAIAGLTRPTGAAVIVAVVVAAVFALINRRRTSGPSDAGTPAWRMIAAATIAPIGWLAYAGWVSWRRDDVTGYLSVQNGWGNGFDGGRAFATWLVGQLADVSNPLHVLAGVLVVLGLAAVGVAFVAAVRDGQPPVLLVYSGLLIVLSLGTARYFASKPRYLFPAFPLMLPLAMRLARSRVRWSSPALRIGAGAVAVVAATLGAAILLGSSPP